MCFVIWILRKNELQSKKPRKSVWPPSYLNGLVYNTQLSNVCIYEVDWLTLYYTCFMLKNINELWSRHTFLLKTIRHEITTGLIVQKQDT